MSRPFGSVLSLVRRKLGLPAWSLILSSTGFSPGILIKAALSLLPLCSAAVRSSAAVAVQGVPFLPVCKELRRFAISWLSWLSAGLVGLVCCACSAGGAGGRVRIDWKRAILAGPLPNQFIGFFIFS